MRVANQETLESVNEITNDGQIGFMFACFCVCNHFDKLLKIVFSDTSEKVSSKKCV